MQNLIDLGPTMDLSTQRCNVMGVVNVTPDSFSDGGFWFDHELAIDHGLAMIAAGADIIDVGGESTRPGALRIGADEEMRRVLTVIEALAATGVPISVDTTRSEVAAKALESGACMLNDVSGGRADPQMFSVAAESAVPLVLMHWRGHSATMQRLTHYDDVVVDVMAELRAQIYTATQAGVRHEQIIIDPGLGFSKTGGQNWTILNNLASFVSMGYPVMVGASRKRFLGELLADSDELRPATERDPASAAVTTVSASAGAWGVRVHQVGLSADSVRVVQRLEQDAS